MPSATFERFVRQLNAQGRDKADGFDRGDFDGLAPEERPEVARLLEEALARGDSTAVGGLLLFDPQGAPATLRAALRRLPPQNAARTTIAGTLLSLAPDSHLQQELVRALHHPSATMRRLALNYLSQSAPNRALVPALRAYVHEELDTANRALGAEILLYWSGTIPNLGESYRRYGTTLDALEQTDDKSRRLGLSELDRLLAEAA